MTVTIGRRELLAALGGAAAAWPLAAHAQQPERTRRIGALMLGGENDPVRGTKGWLSTFTRRLAELGWTDGRNLRMDVRWDDDNVDRQRMYAKELADLQPDVILAPATPQTAAFQQQTRTIPIVFVMVSDPIGSGFVASLPRPGGNITGFMLQEAGMAGKWLEFLTEVAPAVRRAALMFNPDTAPFVRSFTCPYSRRPPAHSNWCPSQRPFIATPKSKQSLARSGASREAAWSSRPMASRPVTAR